jgi:small subunit ribosomal protein S8
MDPIANMLTSIRNGQAVSKETVVVPFSKLKFEIAKVLEKQGFVGKVKKKGRKIEKNIEIELKYKDGQSLISGLKKISKPGQRIYTEAKNIKKVRNGYGISIISTSKGLMTGQEARKRNIGGELICKIW